MAEGQEIVCQILDAEKNIVAETKTAAGKEQKVQLAIPQVHLWNGTKDPYLYTAQVILMAGEQEMDRVQERFGCRTFSIDPEKGFFLNGKSMPLRGVSRHQDMLGKGNALTEEDHWDDADQICGTGSQYGASGALSAQPGFYQACAMRGIYRVGGDPIYLCHEHDPKGQGEWPEADERTNHQNSITRPSL